MKNSQARTGHQRDEWGIHVNAQPRARNRTESRNTGSQGRRAKTLSRALDADSEGAAAVQKTQPRPQDAQAQTVEKGVDSIDSCCSQLGTDSALSTKGFCVSSAC